MPKTSQENVIKTSLNKSAEKAFQLNTVHKTSMLNSCHSLSESHKNMDNQQYFVLSLVVGFNYFSGEQLVNWMFDMISI